MQTSLQADILSKASLAEAERILRSCVHCGFCTAVCPTYRLLGNELDSPRGRIYLIKQILEGQEVTEKTTRHLDRCLMCRGCETICPSGVEYFRLLNSGKSVAKERLPSGLAPSLKRTVIRKLLTSGRVFSLAAKLGGSVQADFATQFEITTTRFKR
jgi:glycolate oxidase iron-sulfur subunit